MATLRAVQHLAWSYDGGPFEDAVARVPFARRIAVLTVAGLLTTVVTLVLRRATGGESRGLNAAVAYASGRLRFVPTIASGLASIVLVALGVSLGREAAPKDLGGAFASAMSLRLGLSRAERRVLVACGAGAGIAAVYNVPLGGALFATEILLGTLSLSLVLPALLTSAIATAVAWIALPPIATYDVARGSPSASLVVWSLLFGPLAGLAATGFVRGTAWSRAHAPRGRAIFYEPVLLLASLGIAACVFPQILGNGKNVVQDAFVNGLDFRLLGTLAAFKVLATFASLRSGAPGGLFTPTISAGALLGGFAGHLWTLAWPAPEHATFAFVAAGAFLAAASRGPLSAIVLIVELTQTTEALIVPLVLATVGATIVARRFASPSIYTTTPAASLRDERLGPWLISASATIAELARRRPPSERPFFVIDEKARYVGVVSLAIFADDAAGVPIDVKTASDVARASPSLVAGAAPDVAAVALARDGGVVPVVDERRVVRDVVDRRGPVRRDRPR